MINFPVKKLGKITDTHTLQALQIINTVDQEGEQTTRDRAVALLLMALKDTCPKPSAKLLEVAQSLEERKAA